MKEKIINMKKKDKILYILMLVKYIFSICITFVAFSNVKSKRYILIGIIEIILIAFISNLLLKLNKKAGIIVNSVLMLMYNAQMLVLYFASSYISMIMLSNLGSVEDLSGKAFEYIFGIAFVIVLSVLPIKEIEFDKLTNYRIISAMLLVELWFTFSFGNLYSPMYAYIDLTKQKINKIQQERANSKVTEDKTELFYSEDISDCIDKPDGLTDSPNIILIFTEGLSENIIQDERDIMPNVRAFQEDALFFSNYYNHTFATYRGIIGQLYSGYQNDNYDSNSLISIQHILKDEGYYTVFFNTEPNNKEFTSYLEELGFDEVTDLGAEKKGAVDSVSDKDAYDALYKLIEERNVDDKPIFVAMYTFGTHASLDSFNEKYGDGSDAMLNKFYNLDVWFGQFIDRFNSSDKFDDTLLVFTGDHCTYGDLDFNNSFPEATRVHTMIDRMPLCFYYKGIKSSVIDVNGRNSLDLAPTLLDYLDVNESNYFLGTSLFGNDDNYFDSYFEAEGGVMSTKNSQIAALSEAENAEFFNMLNNYFIANQQFWEK
ncbi:MAG: sulfatase-like hydrolase/transferase [Lachnospiraceae bacterium]|nr:sulfatase-like hydrolase/transferase [Lachnospiraceae bacterium]